jgi:hypothetical protein
MKSGMRIGRVESVLLVVAYGVYLGLLLRGDG